MIRSQHHTIGLFGYYGRHNFGDDLMAALFARKIVDCGADCIVYGMDSDFGRRYGVRTTRSIGELIAGSRVVAYGGGGALLPQSVSQDFSRLIGELIEACARRKVPLACFSIGGAGLPLGDVTPPIRRRLVEFAVVVTVRDLNDAMLLRDAGVRAEFYHDVVWSTAATFPHVSSNRMKSRPARIAVNLYPAGEFRSELDRAFAAIAERQSTTTWNFVETHTFPPEYWQAYWPDVACERFHRFQFQGIDQGLAFLADCDLVVTNRLHVGVAAMSFGVPCLALAPEVKTKNCFEHVGLSVNCRAAGVPRELVDLDNKEGRRPVVAAFEQVDRTELEASAEHHFVRLRELIEGLPP